MHKVGACLMSTRFLTVKSIFGLDSGVIRFWVVSISIVAHIRDIDILSPFTDI